MGQAGAAADKLSKGGNAEGRHAEGRHADPKALSDARSDAVPYAVYLYIWGLAWIASAALTFLQQFLQPGAAQIGITAIAVTLTGWVLYYRRRKNRPVPSTPGVIVIAAVPVVMGVLFALARFGWIDPLDGYIGKGLLLAIVYAGLSRSLGRPVVYLSLWQFAVALTIGWSYLGYAPVLIDAFGGAGMVALGVMIHIWKRGWVNQ
ncbi:hypothetical protein [Paenibacillus validus]|uniref:Uncharacterized protein n=1 Tax=Paenibacillus validus TaxID=44253 RepID=A0A7X2ZF60_9BACL|nr:hypothetical protein [Paenibacillus validus]MUG73772.1 hypothetical protein [Paenibacillus validus]